MRDAFGGSFMIRVFMIFILIYILLTAVFLNYAKAYRAKELMIKYLEENEIFKIDDMPAEEKTAMEEYFEKVLVGKIGYVTAIPAEEAEDCISDGSEEVNCDFKGVKIERFDLPTVNNKLGIYYKVTTYYRFDMGFLRLIKAADNSEVDNTRDIGKWKISGETRPIVRK